MSAFSAWSESIAGLAGDSIVLVLVAQVDGGAGPGLAGAWDARGAQSALAGRALAHGRRGRRAGGGPLVGSSDREYRFAAATPATVEVARSASIAPAGTDRAAPVAVSLRESIEAIDPAPASASVAQTGGGTQPGSISQGPSRSLGAGRRPGRPMGGRRRLVDGVDLAGRRPRPDSPADRGEPGLGPARPAVVGGS